METEQQKVINTIAKLLRLARGKGTTPAEAATAAAKAQELLDRYKLSMELVESAERTGPEEEVGGDKDPLWKGGKIIQWKRALACGIADANDCQILILAGCRGAKNSAEIQLVGRPTDLQVVRYLFAYLEREIDRLAKEALTTAPVHYGLSMGAARRVWGNSFRRGAVYEVVNRLRQARVAVRREAAATAAGSRALVRLEERSVAVQRWVDENVKGTYKGGSGGRLDRSAVREGALAARSIQIHSGLAGGSAVRALPKASGDGQG